MWATPAPHCVRATLRTSPPQDAAPPMPLQLHGAGLLCWSLGLGSWVGKGSPQLLPGLGGAIHLAKEMGCGGLGSQEHLACHWKVRSWATVRGSPGWTRGWHLWAQLAAGPPATPGLAYPPKRCPAHKQCGSCTKQQP